MENILGRELIDKQVLLDQLEENAKKKEVSVPIL